MIFKDWIIEKTGEILYTLRIDGKRFQPWVFAPGKYTIRVGKESLGDPESGKIVSGLTASPDRGRLPLRIRF